MQVKCTDLTDDIIWPQDGAVTSNTIHKTKHSNTDLLYCSCVSVMWPVILRYFSAQKLEYFVFLIVVETVLKCHHCESMNHVVSS